MVDARLPQLLERGLRHFALGEIDHAVACWREVLAAEPRNRRAREYLELVASSPDTPADEGEGLELMPTDEVPWFAEPVTAVEESTQALDDWLGPETGDGDLPPVAAGTLPWQEWHSEVALQGTGELPWNVEEAAPAPASDALPDVAGAGTASQEANVYLPPDFVATTGPADAPGGEESLLGRSWSAVLGPEGDGDPWDVEPVVEAMPVDDPDDTPWTPGPGSTGWDVAADGNTVQLGDDLAADVLDLVGEPASAPVAVPAALAGQLTPGPNARAEADTLMQGARELFDLGDFSGSLGLVQKALELQPAHREALAYLDRNQDTLVQMYESKVGPLDTRPRVVLRPDEIVWLNLDHRAGFVLAQIDGTITVDDIYALSGLSRLDTAKILAELVEQGVIAG